MSRGTPLDVARIKADFPILKRQVQRQAARVPRLRGRRRRSRSRCSTRWTRYYREYNANIHRGVYTIAEEATAAFEARPRARSRASSTPTAPHEIVFVAQRHRGDQPRRVLVGARQPARGRRDRAHEMEHHANIVPWHILAAERGVELRWIPLTADYRLDLSRPRPAARRRQAARGHRDVERARHDQRHPPARRRRPRRRRARARRRVPGRPAPRGRRAGLGRRLRRRSPPTRCSARPASARSGPGASCSRRCRRSSAAAR